MTSDATSTITDDEVDDFMRRWSAAMVTNDAEQINQFITSDWVLIDKPGVITRDMFDLVVSSGSLQHSEMSHDLVLTRRIGTDVVVALTRGRNAGTYEGQPISADEWCLELIVHTSQGWKCALTQLTPRTVAPPQP